VLEVAEVVLRLRLERDAGEGAGVDDRGAVLGQPDERRQPPKVVVVGGFERLAGAQVVRRELLRG